jgi:hypothetical protein
MTGKTNQDVNAADLVAGLFGHIGLSVSHRPQRAKIGVCRLASASTVHR